MDMKHLFNQFVGTGGASNITDVVNKVSGLSSGKPGSSGVPGGLAGGLAAGGIVSLLVSNKKARKYAGKAAKLGGAALLGGAAYTLYRNWQAQKGDQAAAQGQAFQPSANQPVASPSQPNTLNSGADAQYQVTLIKAMIAAAKADGHIDSAEQNRIFSAVETLALPAQEKGLIFDLLSKPISVMDIAQGAANEAQKTEIYLASCLVGEIDHPDERKHLDDLAMVLNLPADLKQSIEAQAQQGLLD